MRQVAEQNFFGQRLFHIFLNDPRQRTGAVFRIKPFFNQPFAGGKINGQLNLFSVSNVSSWEINLSAMRPIIS